MKKSRKLSLIAAGLVVLVVAGIWGFSTINGASANIDPSKIGLYMGVFNLSIVLPQLVVSLGVGTIVSRAADKGVIFLIAAASLALSAVAWRSVRIRADASA